MSSARQEMYHLHWAGEQIVLLSYAVLSTTVSMIRYNAFKVSAFVHFNRVVRSLIVIGRWPLLSRIQRSCSGTRLLCIRELTFSSKVRISSFIDERY